MFTSYALNFLSRKISRKPQLSYGKRGRRDVPNEKERARRKKVRNKFFECEISLYDTFSGKKLNK